MIFIERFKSFIEQLFEGWGPEELVSIGAELVVAGCVVIPLVATSVVGRWAIRKYSAAHPMGQAATHAPRFESVQHRS